MLMIFLWGSIPSIARAYGDWLAWLACCIHDCVCHWYQHSSNVVKTKRVVDRERGCTDSVWKIRSSTVGKVFDIVFDVMDECASRKIKVCKSYDWFTKRNIQTKS